LRSWDEIAFLGDRREVDPYYEYASSQQYNINSKRRTNLHGGEAHLVSDVREHFTPLYPYHARNAAYENQVRKESFLDFHRRLNEYEENRESHHTARPIRTQTGIPELWDLLEPPTEVNELREEIVVMMMRAQSSEGLSEEEHSELRGKIDKYRVLLDNAASHSVMKYEEMFVPGTLRKVRGYIRGSTGETIAHITHEGEIMLMGRRIGAYYSPDINASVISQGALCRVYSFAVVQDGDMITIVDKLSPHHRNVATWKFGGDNMAPIPGELLR